MIFNKDMNTWKEEKAWATVSEIHQQPSTWKKTLEQVVSNKEDLGAFVNQVIGKEDFDVILTGAGTSEFVGNSVFAYLNTVLDHKCKSYATTDIVAMPENYLSRTKPTLLISYGRSGNSPESVAAVEVANTVCENIHHLFITCNHDGALSEYAKGKDNCFALNLTPETHDQGFAMTSSFTNMYLATVLTFSLDNLDAATKNVETIVNGVTSLTEDKFTEIKAIVDEFDFDRLVYLGSNANKGVAQESALKMLELTKGGVTTLFDSPLGFRHGPKSILNATTLTVVYLSDNPYTRQYEYDIIKEMSLERNGNKILAVSTHQDDKAKELVDYFYSFDNDQALNNVYAGLEYIVVAQLIALFKSLFCNLTPDNPNPEGQVNRVVKGVIIYPYSK